MLSKLVRAVLAAAIAFGATASEAARVAPMIVEVQPSGRGAIARVELTNPDARTFPVEAQMMRGEISDTGELTLTPAASSRRAASAMRSASVIGTGFPARAGRCS